MGLKHTKGRIVVKVDLEGKNSHRFSDGTVIRLERGYDNFNKREVSPVNATVISGEGIPEGAEILIHHNSAAYEGNRINNYKNLSGEDIASPVKYMSIPETECYAWRVGEGEFQPIKGFQFALRVFKPYEGGLVGIPPSLLRNVLYITTGALAGTVCHVLLASDYEVIYQGADGTEKRIIRLRHDDEEEIEREEIIAVDNDLTKQMQAGELLAGLNPRDAQQIQINAYAD